MRLLLIASVLVLLSAVPPAHADTASFLLNFEASGQTWDSPEITGSLIVTGIAVPMQFFPTAYYLTSGSGTLDGNPISLVTGPLGTSPGQSFSFPSLTGLADDIITPDWYALVDDQGIAFTDGTRDYDLHFIFDENVVGIFLDSSVGGQIYNEADASVSITPLATPEPASLTLLGTGLFGIAGVIRRRPAAS